VSVFRANVLARGRGRFPRVLTVGLLMLAGVLGPAAAAGQESTGATEPVFVPIRDLDAAPRPTASIRRAPGPIEVDGVLDEPAWREAEVISEFIQQQPNPGHRVSERTEVRLLYDDDHLYVGVELFDSDPSGIIIPSLERDPNTRDGDAFGIILDTFLDRSSAFAFYVNPGGAVRDGQVSDDGRNANFAWDGELEVRTRVHEWGWTVEMAIPWRTLRFDPGRTGEAWGLNLLRRIRRKSEDATWAPMDRQRPLHTASRAGTLLGLEGIEPGRNLSLKPFVLSNRPAGTLVGPEEAGLGFDAGVDLKYGITPGLTLDLTYNTDFSQVEVDQEQVNLTRFSLFFPERRDFFLENQGVFNFGEQGGGGRGRSGVRRQDLTLFHSRRIGLTPEGDPLPILGGGRISGTAGPVELGLLNMRTRGATELPGEDFSVARLRLKPATGLDVGGMLVQRRAEGGDQLANRSWGVDANYQWGSHLLLQSYVAATEGGGVERDLAGRVGVNWRDPFWEISALHRRVGEDFNPRVGFVRRRGIQHSYATVGVHPRPDWTLLQELNPFAELHYLTDLRGVLSTRTRTAGVDFTFRDGSQASVQVQDQFERILEPFSVRGVTVGSGDYLFREAEFALSASRARPFSASVNVAGGGFFSGDRMSLGGDLRWRASHRFLVDLTADHNRIDLPGEGFFTADVYGGRLRYFFSTRFLTSAFVQYNEATDELVTNLRMNWVHAPLSDLFLVLTERRDMSSDLVMERVLSAKVTRMVSF
jgi:hypothetical protein